jgi:N-acetylglucosamine malate deacetylase 1
MIVRLKNFVRRYLKGRTNYKFFVSHALVPNDAQLAADVLATLRHVRALDPVIMGGPKAERIVIIAPHPDDEIIGPGGTLLHILEKGASVKVIYLTAGDADPELAARRRAEAEAVAAKLGFETTFLDFEPGSISVDDATQVAFSDAVNAMAPQAMFLPFVLDDHEDHRRASALLMAVAGHLKTMPEIWSYQVYSTLPGNVVVDITDVSEVKAEAIAMFGTQMEKRDWAHYALGLNAFNSRLLADGSQAKYVEAFFVLPIEEYICLCRDYFDDAGDNLGG